MTEWWTYRLSDFVMYSPHAYARLVEMYNRELWPGQLVALAAAGAALWLATRAAARRPARLGLVLVFAAGWLWVAWAFYWQRYGTIDLSAPWFAAAFGLEAALLLALGMGGPEAAQPPPWARRTGWVLLAGATLAWPLYAPVTGRPWAQAEVFAWMPQPTAWATLGLLGAGPLGLPPWRRRVLAIVPVLALLAAAVPAWA